ncbi:MAG: hypothetical protein Q9218_002840 [Villophora microphyllina]
MSPSIVYLAAGLACLVVYELFNLVRFVRQARATGLPYVVTPVLETETVGLLATPLLRWMYNDYLERGNGWPRWCRFIIKDWSWEDKRRAHDEYGDVFLCVSPQGIICYSADAAMGWDVMNRRNDFTKPPDKYSEQTPTYILATRLTAVELLELYGPNVATAEGATYRFHVRVTAPPFGDLTNVNELVWNETVHQTQRLLDVWSKQSSRELHMDVNSLTLAVISLAGFGKRVDWTNSVEEEHVPPGYKLSFLKAISDTTTYMVAILLFPGWLLNFTPLRKAHTAHVELDRYLREMIREEQSQIERDSSYEKSEARANLLTSVIRASKTEAQIDSKKTGSSRKDMFTEDEVLGNLFIYLLAGYETTANAIIYGLIVLALYPEIQSKVAEEINALWSAALGEGRNGLSYTEDFEKLIYTYAFMYETFRMYPGVILITKMASAQQPIHVSGTSSSSSPVTHLLPSGTRVYLSSPGVQLNPRYWPDPYTFSPDRWLSPSSSNATLNNSNGSSADKRVVASDRTRHMRGTLLTFSDGARACLGRKFAQAEYVAFLTALLKDYRVTLAPHEDLKRVERDLFQKCAGKVTLSPYRNVGLTLQRRH